jgi:hypothetical protein
VAFKTVAVQVDDTGQHQITSKVQLWRVAFGDTAIGPGKRLIHHLAAQKDARACQAQGAS